MEQFFKFWEANLYTTTLPLANYNVPINKFPITDWMSLNTKYTANYDWLSAPLSMKRFGNTIQNSNRKQINASMNFNQLYRKAPFLKKLMTKKSSNSSRRQVSMATLEDTIRKPFKDYLNDLLSGNDDDKNVSVSYSQNQGTLLPGFTRSPGFFGQDWSDIAPGIPFALGSQNVKIAELSAQKTVGLVLTPL